MTTLDEAAAREIERLNADLAAIAVEKNNWFFTAQNWRQRFLESERQRKILAERIAELGIEGINAATGAGRGDGKH